MPKPRRKRLLLRRSRFVARFSAKAVVLHCRVLAFGNGVNCDDYMYVASREWIYLNDFDQFLYNVSPDHLSRDSGIGTSEGRRQEALN